jgi:hypothetical protein
MEKSNAKKTILSLIVGVALLAVILTACAPSRPQAMPEEPVAEAPGEAQRITLEDSKAAFDNGEALFLDVRSESSYATSHIPNAVSIPLSQLEGRIGELDPNQWIITYCT